MHNLCCIILVDDNGHLYLYHMLKSMVLKLRKKWANVIEKCVYLCVCLPSEEDTIAIKLIVFPQTQDREWTFRVIGNLCPKFPHLISLGEVSLVTDQVASRRSIF